MQKVDPCFRQILRNLKFKFIIRWLHKCRLMHNIPLILSPSFASFLFKPLIDNILQDQGEQIGPEAQIFEYIILFIIQQFPTPLQNVHLVVISLEWSVIVINIVYDFLVTPANHLCSENWAFK